MMMMTPYDEDAEMLQDIELRIHKTLYDIGEEYEEKSSLAIPAVLLKLTLQIYKTLMTNEEDVSKIVMSSLATLDDIPKLGEQETIH